MCLLPRVGYKLNIRMNEQNVWCGCDQTIGGKNSLKRHLAFSGGQQACLLQDYVCLAK